MLHIPCSNSKRCLPSWSIFQCSWDWGLLTVVYECVPGHKKSFSNVCSFPAKSMIIHMEITSALRSFWWRTPSHDHPHLKFGLVCTWSCSWLIVLDDVMCGHCIHMQHCSEIALSVNKPSFSIGVLTRSGGRAHAQHLLGQTLLKQHSARYSSVNGSSHKTPSDMHLTGCKAQSHVLF